MSIPYMNKLDVLRKISPALGPPGPGSPAVDARGPVIAIEGPGASLLREIRPVVERALRASGECDLRVWADSSVERARTPAVSPAGGKGIGAGEDIEMGGGAGEEKAVGMAPKGTRDYLLTILEWDAKSAEIVRHVTSRPPAGSATGASSSTIPVGGAANTTINTNTTKTGNDGSSSGSKTNSPDDKTHLTTSVGAATRKPLTPVALIAGGFSLTLSDRFASTVAITDPYSPVDHWQWMATLWRGIVGPDLVVYARSMTAEEEAAAMGASSSSGASSSRAGGGGAGGGSAGPVGTVEYRAPGVMVVRVAGDRVDEKTERRLAFEVMEWVRAGSYRDGYHFAEGPGV